MIPILHTIMVTAVGVTICFILSMHLHMVWTMYRTKKAKAEVKPAEQASQEQSVKANPEEQKSDEIHGNPADAHWAASVVNEFTVPLKNPLMTIIKVNPADLKLNGTNVNLAGAQENAFKKTGFASSSYQMIKIIQVVGAQRKRRGEKDSEDSNLLNKVAF